MTAVAPLREKVMRALRGAGYRLTRPRARIVDVLLAAEGPLTPAEVHRRVQQTEPQVGLVTVYRTLEALRQLGVVQRVHVGDDCQTYVLVGFGHRHIALCRQCGSAIVVDGEGDTRDLEARLFREQGFVVEDHVLQFWGTCAACREGTS